MAKGPGKRSSASGTGKAGRKRAGKGSGQGSQQTLPVVAAIAAFLVAVAIFPFEVPGLPPGNPLGPAGEKVRSWLVTALGLGSAAVPLCLLSTAVSLSGRWSRQTRKRAWILSGGLLFLLPLTAYVLARPLLPETGCPPDTLRSEWTGFLGAQLTGGPLCGVVGWLGTMLLAGAGWVAMSVWVFGFNPLTLAGNGVVRASRGTGRAARYVAGAAGEAAAGYRARRRQAAEEKRAAAIAAEAAREATAQQEQAAAGRAEAPAEPAATHEDLPWEAEAPFDLPEGEYVPKTGELLPPDGASPPRSATAATAPAPAADEPPAAEEPPPASIPAQEDPPPVASQPWPSLELLAPPEHRDRLDMERELDHLGEVLVKTLATFNIRSSIGGRTTGPAVTQFEVVPAAGVKVNRIASLDADLALATKARSVRIVAPIPGKGAVGVEIPNPEPEMVRLREILGAAAFARSGAALPLALGKDLTGRPYVTDLTKMPHALIAGATGSGKSVCLNTIITSLVYKNGPDRLRLLLIDPKMVELSAYSDLPHLRHPVVTDPKDAAGVLKWAVLEMERRYALLSANGVRSLKEFNARVENDVPLRRTEPDGPEGDEDRWLYTDGPLPYVVVVVDELADLMMQVQADVEKPLAQLAQKARAIGIHLLVATQRPTVNVVTGLIKANFPCRIAFRVASKTDSRTILDQNGADSLLGHGDMLFLPPGQSGLVRMQGAFISTEDTEALMGWYREQAGTLEAVKARVTRNEDDILEAVRATEDADEDGGDGPIAGDWDDLFREAAVACIQQGGGSTSLLQRRLRIGYGRAARIVDQLHDAGVLGPPDGSKPREVMVGPGGLDEICPS